MFIFVKLEGSIWVVLTFTARLNGAYFTVWDQQGFSLNCQTCSQTFNYNYTKIGDKNVCLTLVRMYFVCLCVCVCTVECTCEIVYLAHISTHMCVRVHFIRDRFDLRQFLAMLHRYCRRQQLGQIAEKDGMKRRGVKRADGGKER